jgi:hypothetical protein
MSSTRRSTRPTLFGKGSHRLWNPVGRGAKRSLEALRDVWPVHGISDVAPEESRRHFALAAVLTHLPKRDFQRFADAMENITWFIPDWRVRAWTQPVRRLVEGDESAGHPAFLYLSPMLENEPYALLLAVVAHEVAHLVLGHTYLHHDDRTDLRQEEEAWQKAASWGLEQEVHWEREAIEARWAGGIE